VQQSPPIQGRVGGFPYPAFPFLGSREILSSAMSQPRRANGFYDTPAWKAARRTALIRDGYRCVICGKDISAKGQARVDHRQPLSTHPHLSLNLDNLRSLCANHDNQGHREKRRRFGSPREEKMIINGCDEDGTPLDPAHRWRG
jgi:hypothetical protein